MIAGAPWWAWLAFAALLGGHCLLGVWASALNARVARIRGQWRP